MKKITLSILICLLGFTLFSQEKTELQSPNPIFPFNNCTVNYGEINFSWSYDCDGCIYEILISSDSNFVTSNSYISTKKSKEIIVSSSVVTMYWKVRALRGKEFCSNWSKTISFNVQNISPCGRIGGCSGCETPCGRRRY